MTAVDELIGLLEIHFDRCAWLRHLESVKSLWHGGVDTICKYEIAETVELVGKQARPSGQGQRYVRRTQYCVGRVRGAGAATDNQVCSGVYDCFEPRDPDHFDRTVHGQFVGPVQSRSQGRQGEARENIFVGRRAE
jgi:hypothetical protein